VPVLRACARAKTLRRSNLRQRAAIDAPPPLTAALFSRPTPDPYFTPDRAGLTRKFSPTADVAQGPKTGPKRAGSLKATVHLRLVCCRIGVVIGGHEEIGSWLPRLIHQARDRREGSSGLKPAPPATNCRTVLVSSWAGHRQACRARGLGFGSRLCTWVCGHLPIKEVVRAPTCSQDFHIGPSKRFPIVKRAVMVELPCCRCQRPHLLRSRFARQVPTAGSGACGHGDRMLIAGYTNFSQISRCDRVRINKRGHHHLIRRI